MARRISSSAPSWQTDRRAEVVKRIPRIYAALEPATKSPGSEATVVVYHSRDHDPHYGVCNLQGEPHAQVTDGSPAHSAALAVLHEAHSWYLKRELLPPDIFVSLEMSTGQAWHGRNLDSVVNKYQSKQVVDARTLRPIKVHTPSTGEPPRLFPRAQAFTARQTVELQKRISKPRDRPEEAFLLEVDLLRLAVDSLEDADVLDPLPIHLNGLWVFARPVVMQRPDGTDRFVRALWFRQGKTMWRIRSYAAGSRMRVKDVGEVSGVQPFVPVWDETRPEQKLLAAVWALMAQGGVTENSRSSGSTIAKEEGDPEATPLSVVRLKAGTEHAEVYGNSHGSSRSLRGSWSVRGHWRRQPYRSLGVDETGKVRTRPIWIASYVKGNSASSTAPDKVIVVRH